MTLFQASFLWASKNPFLARRLPRYGFVRRAVRRFMPGETAEDALAEAGRINQRGAGAILTLLGENAASGEDALDVVDRYKGVLDGMRRDGLDVEISVKPTHLGMDLGPAVAELNLKELLEHAAEDATMVWVDMEASGYVDDTLELFRAVLTEYEHVGLCLQAYLYRTEDDLEALLPLAPAIRLVKGAYLEPPSVAYPSKVDLDAAYMRLCERLLAARAEGKVARPAFGTHDPVLIRNVIAVADRVGVSRSRWEVEMLYGIGTREQDRLLLQGCTVRILVSYGTHWFPWYMRRLAERPANLGFVLRQLLPV